MQEEDNSSPDPTRETKRTRSLVFSPDKMIENAVSSFETIEITTSLNIINLMLVGVKGREGNTGRRNLPLNRLKRTQRERNLL